MGSVFPEYIPWAFELALYLHWDYEKYYHSMFHITPPVGVHSGPMFAHESYPMHNRLRDGGKLASKTTDIFNL